MANQNLQQILSTDAKYSTCRIPHNSKHKSLYMQRRGQLLWNRQRLEDNAKLGANYLELRSSLLQRKYCNYADQVMARGCHLNPRSSSRLTGDGDVAAMASTFGNISASPSKSSFGSLFRSYHDLKMPSSKSEICRPSSRGSSVTSERFQFSGFKHIFDQHKDSVSVVKFGHNDASLLGASSYDGSISICRLNEDQCKVDFILRKHTAAITAFDWSSSNDLLVSAGMDGIICLWQSSTGDCLRSVPDQANCQILSCVFHPLNSNWIVAGNSNGYVQVLNVSTGRYPQGGTSLVADGVTALTFDHSGSVLWAGNSKGTINSFEFNIGTGTLRKGRRTVISSGASITCLTYRSGANRDAKDSNLLVNCACNGLFLYRISGRDKSLHLMKKFSIPHLSQPIQSTFSPIVSYGHGSCIVSGSEDCEVWILDMDRESNPVINKLQGHQSPVLSVAFNYDETLLASSDATGLIIAWK